MTREARAGRSCLAIACSRERRVHEQPSSVGEGRHNRTRVALKALLGFAFVYLTGLTAHPILQAAAERVTEPLAARSDVRFLLTQTASITGVTVLQLALVWWISRVAHGRRLEEELSSHHVSWWVDLLVGAALAGLAIGMVFALELAAGWLAIERWVWQELAPGAWLQALYLSLLAIVPAAIVDEALFRAHLLGRLHTAWGKPIALLVASLCFAVPRVMLRAAQGPVAPISVIQLALPSAVLGWVFLRTESPWLPLGIGIAWDLLKADLLNLVGEEGPASFGALTRQQGPAWFVGTKEGVEYGVGGVLGLAIIAAGVWLWTRHPRQR
jgi:membrane protease YdiL (CAAX protease family)